ncbi:MAG TPA: hypothetical protein PLG25_02430 [bacterium]|nr:hypothetical protein [bacterium]
MEFVLAHYIHRTIPMKFLIYGVLFCCFGVLYADTLSGSEVDSAVIRFRQLVREHRIIQLSRLIKYPLRRTSPIPDIQNPYAFIRYFPVLFDSSITKRLNASGNDDLVWRTDHYEMVDGRIWLDSNGYIVAIPYVSSHEEHLISQIKAEACAADITDSVFARRTRLFWDADAYIIRVDETAEGLRYSSWNRGKSVTQSPDLMLWRGSVSNDSSRFIFIQGVWRYILTTEFSPDETKPQKHFLEVWKADTLKMRLPCEELAHAQQISRFCETIHHIRNDRIVTLSRGVRFPFGSLMDMLPPEENPDEFILSYPLMVDSMVHRRFNNYHPVSIAHKYGYMWEDLFFDDNCRLTLLGYKAALADSIFLWLQREVTDALYSELREFGSHDMMLISDNHVLRIDWMDEQRGWRYVAWRKGKAISDVPDIILYGGTAEYHGNMGSKTLTFTNGTWSYIIDYWVNDYLNPTLIIKNNAQEIINTKCQRITFSDCKLYH